MRTAEENGKRNAFPQGSDSGLTKREWFAGMALQGLLANPATLGAPAKAIQAADELLRQLSQEDKA